MQFVSVESVCNLAAQAWIAAVGTSGETAGPIWLIRVGTTRYVVFDGVHTAGGRQVEVVLDDTFQYPVTIVD